MKKFIFFLVIIILESCATTTQYIKNSHHDSLEDNTSKIYVLRPSILGSALQMNIFDNKKLIGKLGPESFLCWKIDVGEHVISSYSENEDHLTFLAEPGKIYYLELKTSLGWAMARVSIDSIDSGKGQKILKYLNSPYVYISNK
jgi:hypothetical protein